jgi:signal transduction histidine kinase
MNPKLHINSVLGDLELKNASVNMSDMVHTVHLIFENDSTSPGLILLKEGQFYGLLSRVKFFEIMSRQFMYDLYSKRRIDHFFEKDNSRKYLILSSTTSIITATNRALKRSGAEIFEPIIVTCENNEYKLLDFYQLLVAQSNIQLLMNEILKRANEFKKEVLAIATHDLRNPIGTILGFSDLIAGIDDLGKCKEFALYIHKSATQMEDLVNSFLVSTINDSIEYKLEFSNFDIVQLLSSIIKEFEFSAEKKKQHIEFETMNSSINITSDHLKIKEVIENLLSNAIKYSEEKKIIKVFLRKSDDYIEIDINDQGPGFSKSDLKKIYGKFQRLSAKPTGDESSTGLGLFITKTIIDKLNGTVNLESEEGKGTTFKVKLPLLNETKHSEINLSHTMINEW